MRVAVTGDGPSDPSDTLTRYAPDLASAMFAYGQAPYRHSRLTLREFEAARIRTAVINGCMVCKSFRAKRDLNAYIPNTIQGGSTLLSRGPAPDEELYDNIKDWRASKNYSDRERMAIELAEHMGLDPAGLGYDDEFWIRCKALFSDAEIVDLTLSIGGWMGAGRVLHALGLDTTCPATSAAS